MCFCKSEQFCSLVEINLSGNLRRACSMRFFAALRLKNPFTNNVGGGKKFSRPLRHALRAGGHFVLVEVRQARSLRMVTGQALNPTPPTRMFAGFHGDTHGQAASASIAMEVRTTKVNSAAGADTVMESLHGLTGF